MSFVHLHLHTHYSFLQGLGYPEDFVAQAKKLGMTALAITDGGNLYGAFEFFKACNKEGIKPIIGVEVYIAAGGLDDRSRGALDYSATLLAKNVDGYRNLVQMVTYAYTNGLYNGKPRIDFATLEKYAKDVIFLSGSALGEIPQHVVTGKSEDFVRERVEWYARVFGKDDTYLEIQERKDHPQQANINKWLVDFSRKYAYKLVATNYVHYITPEDGAAQDLFSALGDGRPLDDPDRKTLAEGNYSLRPAAEMAELFAYAPEAVANTLEIAGKIDIKLPYGKPLLPVYTLNEAEAAIFARQRAWGADKPGLQDLTPGEWYVRYLCVLGLNKRFEFGLSETDVFTLVAKSPLAPSDKKLSSMALTELQERSQAHWPDFKKDFTKKFTARQREIFDRLEYELLVVDLMGFNAYFCIVGDFINWAKNNGVPVGPGRGSAAGALLAYLSGITDIDPLKYGLLFERFLNPSRVSMPDIDVDFSDEGRDRVIDYVRQKYGADHVGQICTFGTMAAKAAIKDVGRALGVPFSVMNDWAKLVPNKPGTTIDGALTESMEFKQAYDSNDKLRRIVDQAKKFEGSVRQLGVHACAVVIAPEPITRFCPIQRPPKGDEGVVTQFSAGPLEDIGLLKMDFLGLRNLTIIDRCIRIVRERHGIEIDLAKISYEDPKVFDVFARGDTTGVFQVESAGMRKYLQELKPNAFEDVIVMLSLYRPGPMEYIPSYIKRKHGKEKVSFPHPSLDKILRVTQGIAVYQEQIMQLVQAFAGFSLGEADILRRAIGKKKVELLMEQKQKFVDAAKKQGHDEKLAVHIFTDIIEPFAGYGFNKSHAACYAMIAYQTAYLKAYHTAEFMTALMVSDEEDTDRIVMEVNECRSKGINVLAPDVNESRNHFTYIDAHNIRFGLKAIKGLGDGPSRSIMEGRKDRPYRTVQEFVTRAGHSAINKKSLECLIYAGALDGFGERARLLASMDKMTDFMKETERRASTRQTGFFDMGAGEEDAVEKYGLQLTEVPPMSFEEKIVHERAIIGYMVSGAPLTGLAKYVERRSIGLEHVRAGLEAMAKAVVAAPEADMGEVRDATDGIPNNSASTVEMSPSEGGVIAPEAVPAGADVPPSEGEPLPPEPGQEEGASEKSSPAKGGRRRDKKIPAQLVGYVQDVRRVQTKTDKLMLIVQCQSTFFDFTVVVFPRDYDKFAKIIEAGKVILAKGNLDFKPERHEISLMLEDAKMATLTSVRLQAQQAGLFDPDEGKPLAAKAADGAPAAEPVPEAPRDYVVDVPDSASREDLLELKSFLQTQRRGTVQVKLTIRGNLVDAKLPVVTEEPLANWVKSRWSGK